MKRFFGLVAALTLALSLSAAAVQVGDAVGERFTLPVYEAEWEVLRLTNAARLARGLRPCPCLTASTRRPVPGPESWPPTTAPITPGLTAPTALPS